MPKQKVQFSKFINNLCHTLKLKIATVGCRCPSFSVYSPAFTEFRRRNWSKSRIYCQWWSIYSIVQSKTFLGALRFHNFHVSFQYKERLDEYKRLHTLGKAFGIESHVLGPSETKKLYPLMNVDDVYGTLYRYE